MKPKRPQISVAAKTYERVRELARENGEQVGTFVDGIIRRYLDEQEKTS